MQINNISCVQLMAQPMTFPLNQPPSMPNINVAALPQPVQHLVTPLAAAVANKFSHNVMQVQGAPAPHVGRIFAFNLAAANNYNNPFYWHTCAASLDMMFWLMSRNPQGDVNALIHQAAEFAVNVEVSKIVTSTPQMQQYLDASIINEGRGLLAQHQQMEMEILNMKNRAMPHAQPGYINYGGSAPMTTGATMYSNQSGHNPRYTPPANNNPGYVGGSNPMYSSGAASSAPSGPVNQPANAGRVSLPYLEKNRQELQQRQQVGQSVQYQQPAQPEQELTMDDWRPSNLQMYPPAYPKATHKAVIGVAMDPILTKPCHVIRILQKGEEEMDRSQHQLTAPNRSHNSAVNSALNRKNSTLDEQLSGSFTTSVEEANKQLPDYSSVRNALTSASSDANKFGLATNLAEAIFSAQLKLQRQFPTSTLFKAYTDFTILNTTHVATDSFRPVLENIAQADTLAQVAKIMSQALASAPSHHALAQFIEVLDDFLKNEYNNFLATRLALGNVKLGVFMEDAPQIIDYIRKQRGDVYGDILVESQRQFINNAIFSRFIDEENHLFLTSSVIPELDSEADEETQVAESDKLLTHMPQIISVTAVGVKASDLEIGMLQGVGNMITSESFPALNQFAKRLFRTAAKTDAGIAHHYLVTQDKKIFELSEGIVGVGTILVTCLN